METDSPAPSRRLPKVAGIIAILLAVLAAASALYAGTVVVLISPILLLIGGIGILRKRVWSAYGLALFVMANVGVLLVSLLRENGTRLDASVAVAVVGVLAEAVLFYFAGRSLAQSGAMRGRPLTWILVATAWFLPFVFLQPFVYPTGSMEDTILIGDHILVQRFPRHAHVRGDVVAFVYPVDRNQIYVKRIVGVAGDRIRIERKQLVRNGESLREPYARHKTDYMDAYRDNFPGEPNLPLVPQGVDMLAKYVQDGEVVVPPGKYFVLGDNRDHSLDSRYWGFVDEADILGKPLFVYDSADTETEGLADPGNRRGHTRWNRLFNWIR